jgi:hypothetical protein
LLLAAAGGKTEDFMSAAKLFYRAKRQVKVPTYLVPATQKVRAACSLVLLRTFPCSVGCYNESQKQQTSHVLQCGTECMRMAHGALLNSCSALIGSLSRLIKSAHPPVAGQPGC